MSAKKFWTRQGVADFLRVSRMTLSRWEKTLPLPRDYMGCRLVRLSEEDILAWREKLSRKIEMKQDFVGNRREKAPV